jgi:hypothetical protein
MLSCVFGSGLQSVTGNGLAGGAIGLAQRTANKLEPQQYPPAAPAALKPMNKAARELAQTWSAAEEQRTCLVFGLH